MNHQDALPKPILSYNQLRGIEHTTVVGIDLTGSQKKPCGWASLTDGLAITRRIRSDIELIERTVAQKPAVISIDAPLSLPVGRISVYDTDPGRPIYGIMRECERALARRGIRSYPCLIKSMQQLTERGIKLATEFRQMGFSVIESYPGGAQDILGIPRKKQGIFLLRDGLRAFGISGSVDQPKVSHDELDAITAALVGCFYVAGLYEAIGNETEGYLILPRAGST